MNTKKPNTIFYNIKIVDVATKGVAVAKTPDGRVIFVPHVVPGEEKHIMKGRLFFFMNILKTERNPFANILGLVAVVNGKIWIMTNSYFIKIMKFLTI
jgi:hypothetical protein